MYVRYYILLVKFEWDEQKNYANIDKHGVAFLDAENIFLSERVTAEDKRREYGENRMVTVGLIGKNVCVVVYTLREDTIRIISARKANSRERRRYYERIEKSEIEKD